jgi:hypothetical protein
VLPPQSTDPAFRVPQAGDKPYAQPSAAGNDQVWVLRGDKVTPIAKGTAQPGDVPYDPVAARQPGGTAGKAQEIASEAARVAKALRVHPGMNNAFGVLDSKLPTFRQSTADAEVLRNTLQSLLTLDNMGLMKGVLSDSDMKVIQQASTTLANTAGDAAAAAELDRLIPILERASGAGAGAGGTVTMVAPDGSEQPVPADQVEHYRSRGARIKGQ